MIVSNSITGGGAEISMMRLFLALRNKNFLVSLCALNEDGITRNPAQGMVVIGRSWGAGPLGTLRNLRKFRQHLKQEKPDIMLVNCELPELYVSLCASKGSNLIIVEHTSRPWNGRRSLGFIVRSILLLRRARWVTVSRDRYPIWPYSIDPIFIPNAHVQDNSSIPADSAELVFVGRLNHGKHPEVVAEAARLTNSTADFFGDGPDLGNLKQKYDDSQIRFHGFIENPWRKISPTSLVIVASEYEGDGMNVIEAVANGNPILLADNSDLRRFNFPEGNYFKSLDELTSKIWDSKRVGTKPLKLPHSIRTKLLEEREPNKVSEQWIKLFYGEGL